MCVPYLSVRERNTKTRYLLQKGRCTCLQVGESWRWQGWHFPVSPVSRGTRLIWLVESCWSNLSPPDISPLYLQASVSCSSYLSLRSLAWDVTKINRDISNTQPIKGRKTSCSESFKTSLVNPVKAHLQTFVFSLTSVWSSEIPSLKS